MYYFGTSLNSCGHYFWELEGDFIFSSSIRFKDLPFNPEEMPRFEKDEMRRRGAVKFYNSNGYSICAIEGSCKDDRGGSKSIFWLEENISNEELVRRIFDTPIAKMIIERMPFEVKWFN